MKWWRLRDPLPEGRITRGEERVFAGVPAEEMGRARVGGVMLAAGPDFVEKKRAGLVSAAVKIVLQAAFFPACGADEGAEFRFQQEMLTFLGS